MAAFGFGSSQPAQTPFAGGGGSAFGQSAQSLFGQSSQSLFGQSAQSLFGAPSSQSLFGAQSSQSLFGAQSSQPLFGSAPSLFGSSQSLFASAPSLFASSQSFFQQQQAAQPPMQPPRLPPALSELIERLNPLHPESEFCALLYNIVPSSDITRYKRPPQMNAKLWESGVGENPDPSRLVPVQANLFDDLLERASLQNRRLDTHIAVLQHVSAHLQEMHDSIGGEMTRKVTDYRRRQRLLARRLLRLAGRVECAVTSGGLSGREVQMKKRMQTLQSAIAASGQFKDRLSDLVELVDCSGMGQAETRNAEIVDERAAGEIKELLMEQLKGIEHVSDICDKAERDVKILQDGIKQF